MNNFKWIFIIAIVTLSCHFQVTGQFSTTEYEDGGEQENIIYIQSEYEDISTQSELIKPEESIEDGIIVYFKYINFVVLKLLIINWFFRR